MKPCICVDDQCIEKCEWYVAKSSTDKVCWRHRVELEHCNRVSDEEEEKGTFGQKVK